MLREENRYQIASDAFRGFANISIANIFIDLIIILLGVTFSPKFLFALPVVLIIVWAKQFIYLGNLVALSSNSKWQERSSAAKFWLVCFIILTIVSLFEIVVKLPVFKYFQIVFLVANFMMCLRISQMCGIIGIVFKNRELKLRAKSVIKTLYVAAYCVGVLFLLTLFQILTGLEMLAIVVLVIGMALGIIGIVLLFKFYGTLYFSSEVLNNFTNRR